jgi:hypothetical protein
LKLIRDEKAAINEKMKGLKKSNEQYRQICEGYMKGKVECGINTEDILEGRREMALMDQSVSCAMSSEIKIEDEPETENSDKPEDSVEGS